MIKSIDVLTGEITELPDAIVAEIVISELENKAKAMQLLQATDWTVASDVGNAQMSNPYLANQAEFIAYRNKVRKYAISPIEGNIEWATKPEEVWQTIG